jgi:ribosomal protein S18 acetylase RimI-like enzyme
MTPRIRVAGAADIPALRSLVESAYRGESAKAGWTHEADLLGGQRTDHAALAEMISDPRQAILVAEVGGDLVGCVQVTDKGVRAGEGRIGYLGMLTVRPTLQSAGLGRFVIDAAEAHARAAFGVDVMEMTVISSRRELIEWYIRRGYADTGRTAPFPMDDPRYGIPKTRELEFVVLAKRLAPN